MNGNLRLSKSTGRPALGATFFATGGQPGVTHGLPGAPIANLLNAILLTRAHPTAHAAHVCLLRGGADERHQAAPGHP